jgi:hypothetical protein
MDVKHSVVSTTLLRAMSDLGLDRGKKGADGSTDIRTRSWLRCPRVAQTVSHCPAASACAPSPLHSPSIANTFNDILASRCRLLALAFLWRMLWVHSEPCRITPGNLTAAHLSDSQRMHDHQHIHGHIMAARMPTIMDLVLTYPWQPAASSGASAVSLHYTCTVCPR